MFRDTVAFPIWRRKKELIATARDGIIIVGTNDGSGRPAKEQLLKKFVTAKEQRKQRLLDAKISNERLLRSLGLWKGPKHAPTTTLYRYVFYVDFLRKELVAKFRQ